MLLDYIERAPRNCTYRSQNEMIQALGESVSQLIIKAVKLAGIYSVMTTDTSGMEQASVIVRFVDEDERPCERLIAVAGVMKTNAGTDLN